jgi:hypothetical protein
MILPGGKNHPLRVSQGIVIQIGSHCNRLGLCRLKVATTAVFGAVEAELGPD